MSSKNIKRYVVNTGVKPYDFDPPAGMAFMDGFEDSGNGVYVIPFYCEEVPKNYSFIMASDFPEQPGCEEYLVREIVQSKGLLSKYAFFKKNN